MPRGTTNKKNTSGGGSIRKKTVMRKGNKYTYWEGRYTLGWDPITGKQIQKSISGKTQKEVAQKLRQITHEMDEGTHIEPCKMTVEEWMDIWRNDFLVGQKESTIYLYNRDIELYIKPRIGSIKLSDLTTPVVQHFYNELLKPSRKGTKPLSSKTVRDINGVLHQALQQAVANRMIMYNPTDACKLPKKKSREIKPLEGKQVTEFLDLIKDHPHELLYKITLFTGLREGEILGLTWDCVDFNRNLLTVKQQLRKSQEKGGEYYFSTPKNGKQRVVALAPSVVELFRLQQQKQEIMKKEAGELWENKYNLIFTNASGDRLSYRTVYDCFKRIANKMNLPTLRVHDLRHTYATISIANGDDIKTVQENLGHATAAFTLEVYGHVTEKMQRKSADRLENYIQQLNL